MSNRESSVFRLGNTAIITGGASGIGLALATRCKSSGMNVIICDINTSSLGTAEDILTKTEGNGKIAFSKVDVSNPSDYDSVKRLIEDEFDGKISLLALNAGRSIPAPTPNPWTSPGYFTQTLATNTFGITNGLCALLPYITSHDTPTSVIITGSKQGITNPPGNPAYNASKAAVKSIAESLSYSLSMISPSTSVHLLVPGWTFTGMTSGGKSEGEKPAGAWMPGQVVDYLVQKMGEKKFYVIVPDNDVTEEMDGKRMLWDRLDLVEGREPLTRWRDGYKEEVREWMET